LPDQNTLVHISRLRSQLVTLSIKLTGRGQLPPATPVRLLPGRAPASLMGRALED
jgi:hypothetical protein